MDYSTGDLDDLGRNDERTCKIVALAEDAASHHPRTIVFCPSVESALECNLLLRAEGVVTHVVTANTPGEARRAIINDFKSDRREHMVMFNYGVHRRFRRALYSLRHHRASHHVVGALFTNGWPGDAWSQSWRESKS